MESDQINMLSILELGQINTISEDGSCEEMKLSVASESTETVAPDIMPTSIPTISGAVSNKGVEYDAANGQPFQTKVNNDLMG